MDLRTKRRLTDNFFKYCCFAATLVGVIMLALLLYKIFQDGAGRLSSEFVGSMASSRPEKAGIKAAIVGSVWIMALTALIAMPIGIAAAIYLEEFTQKKNRITEFIQLNIANLAGVPSIVYGLLGLALFVRILALKQSILAGALTMSLLVLPMIILVSQEALRAVPKSYREGSLALGATRWQTISKQVLPSAGSGIFTGIILSLSRAIGETAPLIVVGAVGFVTFLPENVQDRYTVLPIQIFIWSGEPNKGFHEAAAAGIIVLLAALLTLNSFAIYLRARSRNKLTH